MSEQKKKTLNFSIKRELKKPSRSDKEETLKREKISFISAERVSMPTQQNFFFLLSMHPRRQERKVRTHTLASGVAFGVMLQFFSLLRSTLFPLFPPTPSRKLRLLLHFERILTKCGERNKSNEHSMLFCCSMSPPIRSERETHRAVESGHVMNFHRAPTPSKKNEKIHFRLEVDCGKLNKTHRGWEVRVHSEFSSPRLFGISLIDNFMRAKTFSSINPVFGEKLFSIQTFSELLTWKSLEELRETSPLCNFLEQKRPGAHMMQFGGEIPAPAQWVAAHPSSSALDSVAISSSIWNKSS